MGFWDKVLETSETLDERTYYELLGVESDAPLAVIEERFHALARRLHPDRHARERRRDRQAALTRLYARINEAARVLGAPDTRRAYDKSLAQGLRRLDPDAKPKKGPRDTRDPKSPSARSLFQQGKALADARNYRGARAKLALARQLEPKSAAIAAAIAAIDRAEGKAPASAGSKQPPGAAKDGSAKAEPATTDAALAVAPTERAEPTTSDAGPASPAAPTEAAAAESAKPAARPDPAPRPPSASVEPHPPRRHPRFPLRQTVAITANNWSAVERLVTEDVGKGGTFLATSAPFPLGTPVTLRIATPDDKLVEISATVAWVSDGVQRRPGMGLRFDDLDGPTRDRLDQVLDSARAASVPTVEELVETVARLTRLGPEAFELGSTYTVKQLDDAFMPMAMRYDPSRFDADAPARRIADELAELLRAAYQAASRGAGS